MGGSLPQPGLMSYWSACIDGESRSVWMRSRLSSPFHSEREGVGDSSRQTGHRQHLFMTLIVMWCSKLIEDTRRFSLPWNSSTAEHSFRSKLESLPPLRNVFYLSSMLCLNGVMLTVFMRRININTTLLWYSRPCKWKMSGSSELTSCDVFAGDFVNGANHGSWFFSGW